MNRFACIFVALGLAAAGSTTLAAEHEPVLMTDAQMDDVTGGGLFTIAFQDALNNLNVGNFQLTLMANVNAAIAGGDAVAIQSVGTQTITASVPTSPLTASGK